MDHHGNPDARFPALILFVTAVFFYVLAVFGLVNGSKSLSALFLCIGSTLLCCGAALLVRTAPKMEDVNPPNESDESENRFLDGGPSKPED